MIRILSNKAELIKNTKDTLHHQSRTFTFSKVWLRDIENWQYMEFSIKSKLKVELSLDTFIGPRFNPIKIFVQLLIPSLKFRKICSVQVLELYVKGNLPWCPNFENACTIALGCQYFRNYAACQDSVNYDLKSPLQQINWIN